jgi:5'-nucleotidase
MVLSGINHGSNLGTDVLYSGTVSAAMEGVIEGIPSVAFSLASFTEQDFQPAANFARTLVGQIAREPLPQVMLLNANIPAVSEAEIAGVKITRQGVRRYFDQFEKRVDPRGKTYYWLAGEILEDVDEPELDSAEAFRLKETNLKLAEFQQIPTDVQAIRQNYITLTPLQYNLTCAVSIASLRNRVFDHADVI